MIFISLWLTWACWNMNIHLARNVLRSILMSVREDVIFSQPSWQHFIALIYLGGLKRERGVNGVQRPLFACPSHWPWIIRLACPLTLISRLYGFHTWDVGWSHGEQNFRVVFSVNLEGRWNAIERQEVDGTFMAFHKIQMRTNAAPV